MTEFEAPQADWPHSPPHRLAEGGVFMVTAATLGKQAVFDSKARLDALCGGLRKYAVQYGWQLEAWAVFPNHYHFVASSPGDRPEGAATLADFIAEFHRRSAGWVNRQDATPGRQVWHNYWDTKLTFERSYLARLRYVHENPVKHGLVNDPELYPWCSAAEFRKKASPARFRTVSSFKIDRLKIPDDF